MAIAPVLSSLSLGQQASPAPIGPQPADKRILWFIPNYRTSPSLHPYRPLTPQEKFKIAAKDSRQACHGILSLIGMSARQFFTVPGNR